MCGFAGEFAIGRPPDRDAADRMAETMDDRDPDGRAGHRFASTGDSEVILKAYAEWGAGCVERFAGMFAYARYEHAAGRRRDLRSAEGVLPGPGAVAPGGRDARADPRDACTGGGPVARPV
jgi:asparagine synthetase B (glutamine-hydrolysing)